MDLHEILNRIKLIGVSSGLESLLVMGSASRCEFTSVNKNGISYFFSDLELLGVYTKKFDRNKFDANINELKSDLKLLFKSSPDFQIEIDLIPRWRLGFLKNRLLFHEAIKSNCFLIKGFQSNFKSILNKKFDLNECSQTIIWRIFSLKNKIHLNNNFPPIIYYISRNILDCLTVVSYILNYSVVGFNARNDLCINILKNIPGIKDEQVDFYNAIFKKALIIKNNPLINTIEVSLCDFISVANLALLVIEKMDVKIIPSRLDFFKRAILEGRLDFLLMSLSREVVLNAINDRLIYDIKNILFQFEDDSENFCNEFIERNLILFPYLSNYIK